MNAMLRVLVLFCLCLTPLVPHADTRIFNLNNPQPEQILETLRSLYGDKVRADLVQQKLVVVGSNAQLQEIATLLAQWDRAPRALRLTLREQPPQNETDGVVYSTDRGGLSIDTVAGALVTLEYSQIAQQPAGNGWWISIDNVPTEFRSLMLQVQLQGNRSAQVLVSYSKQENQQRRVFGNTIGGALGSWLPLLPQHGGEDVADAGSVTYTTGPKPGSQLYLRIDSVSPANSPR